ncbi:hypothetical protein Tery_0151 [Trichodesmium erythraeum IMS101]|uniref:Uncharacterized protein n=2 Tax=Trichodesmium erythraeum TaxID=1206 RepID=Q11A28_TRIEI|nr:hypothetical protein [Trichodesmium erythraeum GBRTRLIN201]
MDLKHLKFILKLLGYKNYRVSINKIQPEHGMKVSERDEICYRLCDQGLVEFTREVTKINISAQGKSFLDSKKDSNSLTSEELKVLKATARGAISPGATGIMPSYREAVITDLLDQDLIKVVAQKIKEVWLTEKGKQFLCQEYSSHSTAKEISLKMLSDYLQLMRTNYNQEKKPLFSGDSKKKQKPNDDQILAEIWSLDNRHGTDKYLPIFHLREKLQPRLSREELDQALYRLERNHQIELSSLQEVRSYTPEQIEAGIPQNIGGCLFFIILD